VASSRCNLLLPGPAESRSPIYDKDSGAISLSTIRAEHYQKPPGWSVGPGNRLVGLAVPDRCTPSKRQAGSRLTVSATAVGVNTWRLDCRAFTKTRDPARSHKFITTVRAAKGCCSNVSLYRSRLP
jgi:hypothetical protein